MPKKESLSSKVFEIFVKEQKDSTTGELDFTTFVELCKKRIGGGISRNKIKSALISLEKNGVKQIKKGNTTVLIFDTVPQITDQKSQNGKESVQRISGIYYALSRHSASVYVKETNTSYSIQAIPSARNNATVELLINQNKEIKVIDCINPPTKVLGFISKDKETGEIYFYEQSTYGVITNKYLVLNNAITKEAFGKIVTATINNDGHFCTIDKVFGSISSLKEYVRAHAHAINADKPLSPEGEAQLAKIPTKVDLASINLIKENEPINPEAIDPTKPTYVDLRAKSFCTIDPFDCQDMDDAVYSEIDKNGNIVTYAAIADVTQYIRPFSPIWNDAAEKDFTLYTLLGAFDMLPHKIASGICSLNPNEDRLTMCIKTTIDPKTGNVISGEVMQAVINSKRKFSYNEVQNILDEYKKENINEDFLISLNTSKSTHKSVQPTDLVQSLIFNLKASEAVWKRLRRGQTLRLNSNDEVQFYLDKDQEKIERIEQKKHLPSMELIEALMINANEFVAEQAYKTGANVLYRTHGLSSEFKINKFNGLIDCLDCDMEWDGTNASLQKILNYFKGSEYEEIVSEVAKTCLDKAKYTPVPHPINPDTQEIMDDLGCHNALGLDYYSHFTSGIRRFPDLIIQYAMKCEWNEKLKEKNLSSIDMQPLSKEYVNNMAHITSSREDEVDKTSRTIEELALAIYAENHINEIFEGTIRSIIDDNLIVVTKENMRVKIPLEDFMNGRKYSVSDNNVAVISNNTIVTTIGKSIKFKISYADRYSRTISGSTNLTKNFEKPSFECSDKANADILAKYYNTFLYRNSAPLSYTSSYHKNKDNRYKRYKTEQSYKDREKTHKNKSKYL